jgi:hypothetical protein
LSYDFTVAQDPRFTLSYRDESGLTCIEPITAEQVERIIVLGEGLPNPNDVDDGDDDD